MRKLIILITMGVVFNNQSIHSQIQEDKVLHFAAGAVSGAAGALIASKISKRNRFWTVTGSVGASLVAGLAKEAIDKSSGGKWDNGDLGATVLGGAVVGVSIEIFSKKEGKYYVKRDKKKRKKNKDP